MKSYSLDTETGGFDPAACGIVEIAIVDNDTGAVVLNTLIDPCVPIPEGAMAIHGITDAMVAGMPKIGDVLPFVLALSSGSEVVIFNSAFDTKFLPGIAGRAGKISCCMLEAMKPMRVSRWPKLVAAAEWAGYEWVGDAHRALADTLACRHVWGKVLQHRGTNS